MPTDSFTFSAPINSSTLTAADLTLTDNGGPNLIDSSVTLIPTGPGTYQIDGLSGLTSAEGTYVLTLNATGLQTQAGTAITGSLSVSTSWLMDTTTPASTVVQAPKLSDSYTFPVTVTGTDPAGSNGSTPSGIAFYTVYVSTNGGPWTFWTNLTPSSGTPNTVTTTFTGASNTEYGFYSTATDNAGNTEAYNPTYELTTNVIPLDVAGDLGGFVEHV